MTQGLSNALSAIRSGLTSLDVAANNIANANTDGFRASRANLQAGPDGNGVVVSSITRDNSPGAIRQTGQALNVAIDGDSFFEVTNSDGENRFTRNGSFQIDSEGFLATTDGSRLEPGIQISPEAENVSISRDGRVTGTVDGETVEFGRIQSARFANPNGLEEVGGGQFAETEASGQPTRGDFGEAGAGQLVPGGVETSNTDLATSTVDLLIAQRFVQAQTAVVRAQDDILGEIVNLGNSDEG